MVGTRLFGFLALAAASALGGACAAGSEQPPTGAATAGDPSGPGGADGATTSSGASTTTGSTSSVAPGSGGNGGAGPGAGGAEPGTGGSGTGAGGAGSGGAGTGGTGTGTGGAGTGGMGTGGMGTGGDTSQGGGGAGPTSGTVAFFATKSSGAFVAVRDGDGQYVTNVLGGTYAATRPALSMRTATTALALARGNTGALIFTTLNGSLWAVPGPVGDAITTDDVPAVASSLDGLVHATFHGTDGKHYYARFDGSAFDPDDDPVGGVGPSQAFGPSAASIALVGGTPLIVQAGDDDNLYAITRIGAGWGAAVQIPAAPTAADLTPAVTAIDGASNTDALIVFTGASSSLYWSMRERGGPSWSTPLEIADALSFDPPSLTSTPDGAVVAFRGTNGAVYAARFDGSSWGAPVPVVPISTTTDSTPALAPGAGDADAELAFIDDDGGAVVHVRLQNGVFGAPTTVGGSNLKGVAIAAAR